MQRNYTHLIEHTDVAQVDGLPASQVGAQRQVHVLHCSAAVPASSSVDRLPPPHACQVTSMHLGIADLELAGMLQVTRTLFYGREARRDML